MNFAELEKTNVTSKIEKKGRFSYLSWPFAVSEFRKACPNGKWEINRSFEGLPYLKTELGVFVSVTVWPDVGAESICFEQIHPVLNHQNKPIEDPNSFEINTSIQRCLVKAIAIATGIGLYIYAEEDRPPSDNGDDEPPKIELTPESKNWKNAVAAYARDGNFDNILKHVTMSDENRQKLIDEAAPEPGSNDD
jgi:hypothetical protein